MSGVWLPACPAAQLTGCVPACPAGWLCLREAKKYAVLCALCAGGAAKQVPEAYLDLARPAKNMCVVLLEPQQSDQSTECSTDLISV